jgi:16S rRNA processing protein RimM
VTSEPPSLRVGRVLRVHGVAGAVRVESLTDFADRFEKGARLDANGRRLTVASVQPGDRAMIVRFEEVCDRNAAQSLQGAYLTVPLEEARTLPVGRYYHFQLVGLAVIEEAGGRRVGSVAEVLEYPANDVLRVTEGVKETLVPMLNSVVRSIDLVAGRILVHLPDEVSLES